MERKIYLDNAATTYVSSEVLNEMLPCYNILYGNPSSLHSFGREAEAIVDRARDRIASAINAKSSNEIYFTSGGTEADNWAIKGIAHAYESKGKHIVVSAIEHHAILDSCAELEKEGYEVSYVPVNPDGLVNIAELIHAIRRDTTLVSVMAVNNEVGTIQNIKTIGKLCHDFNVIFHTDAVQAIGALKLDVQDMEIDVMSISGHKIYGPKGIGALYVRNGIKIDSIISGGSQERNKRGGTLNVPSIAGLGKAVESANKNLSENQQKYRILRKYFLSKLAENVEHYQLNGHAHQRVQNILNISFYGIEGESILMLLDLKGIAVSTGSACTSKSLLPSHVLKAMGIADEVAQGSIRFSFGKNTSKADIDIAVAELAKIVTKLRSISPLQAGRF
ncbi:MAG: cysteine desulfurase [Clostridia bacterium]|nr:cysteine desulfurase [Clostridia bacterium]